MLNIININNISVYNIIHYEYNKINIFIKQRNLFVHYEQTSFFYINRGKKNEMRFKFLIKNQI